MKAISGVWEGHPEWDWKWSPRILMVTDTFVTNIYFVIFLKQNDTRLCGPVVTVWVFLSRIWQSWSFKACPREDATSKEPGPASCQHQGPWPPCVLRRGWCYSYRPGSPEQTKGQQDWAQRQDSRFPPCAQSRWLVNVKALLSSGISLRASLKFTRVK